MLFGPITNTRKTDRKKNKQTVPRNKEKLRNMNQGKNKKENKRGS